MKRASRTLAALDRQSYHLLLDTDPVLVEAIESDLLAGLEPADIARQALQHMGEDRRRYAKRIEGAARYALRLMGNGA